MNFRYSIEPRSLFCTIITTSIAISGFSTKSIAVSGLSFSVMVDPCATWSCGFHVCAGSPPFHITCFFDFSGYISFVMYISSSIVKRMYLRKAKTISNMKPREYSPYKLFVYSP
jgi:hypothetical protein